MTFAIGQHVAHPSYGPGQIVNIDEQIVQNSTQKYYVIRIINQKLTTRIPLDAVGKVRLRSIISRKQAEKVLSALQQEPQPLPANPNERQSHLKKLIFSGSPVQVAQAVCELTWHKSRKDLTVIDKQLLDKGTEMLVAEVAIATKDEESAVLDSINDALWSDLEKK